MIKHFNIRIRGLVQNVFFRHAAKEKADEFGIRGFVKNEEDGSLYIEAEGDEMNLDRFKNWCHQGPETAAVERVEVEESGILKNFKDFRIEF